MEGLQAPQFELATACLLQREGESFMRVSQFSEAEKSLTRCLELRSKLLLERHPQMADIYSALAELRAAQGRNAEAWTMREKARKAYKTCFN